MFLIILITYVFIYIYRIIHFLHDLVLVLLFLRLNFHVYEYLLGLIIVCALDELKFDCGHKFISYSICFYVYIVYYDSMHLCSHLMF